MDQYSNPLYRNKGIGQKPILGTIGTEGRGDRMQLGSAFQSPPTNPLGVDEGHQTRPQYGVTLTPEEQARRAQEAENQRKTDEYIGDLFIPGIHGMQELIRNDPNYELFNKTGRESLGQLQGLVSTLQDRGSATFKAIDDLAIQPSLNQAAQTGALQQQTTRDALASRGLGRSGASASLEGAAAARTAADMANIRGLQSVGNQEARDRALGMLPGAINLQNDITGEMARASDARNATLNSLDMSILQMQREGIDFENTDFFHDYLFGKGKEELEDIKRRLDAGEIDDDRAVEEFIAAIDRNSRPNFGTFVDSALGLAGAVAPNSFLGFAP
jgi:hypothetical protein